MRKNLLKNLSLVLIMIIVSFPITLAFCPLFFEEDFSNSGGQAAIIYYSDIQNDIVNRYPKGKELLKQQKNIFQLQIYPNF